MGQSVKVLVLRTAGTNCDEETGFAFESCGAQADLVHINRLLSGAVRLGDYQILAIPGGFTYGDDIISGRILANELRLRLGAEIQAFIAAGRLIIGICNGFQVLVRSGILPGRLSGDAPWTPEDRQQVSLTYNDSGRFEARWTHLKVCGRSVWTEGLPERIYLPVAHAEGKFVPQDAATLRALQDNQQVAFRYCAADGGEPGYPDDPNGSVDHIAGITDRTGRILGLMPHPERHFVGIQHPNWTRAGQVPARGDGARIFENGVRYIRDRVLVSASGA